MVEVVVVGAAVVVVAGTVVATTGGAVVEVVGSTNRPLEQAGDGQRDGDGGDA